MHRCTRVFAVALPLAPVLAVALVLSSAAQVVPAPVVLASPVPQTGSSNPVSPEPGVPRPGTTPCSVALFSNLAFNDYGTRAFTFAQPLRCPGPWAKVVLTADFTVTAGRQFDRTAKFYLGGVNVYFGTTAEPRSTLSPSWHIERDITELSSILNAQTGLASVQNIVNSTYTGIIYGSASLLFYPADSANPAPAVPSVVVPLTSNDTFRVNSTSDKQSAMLGLPRNIERAYLDVVAQAQSNDEFWYTCVPSDVADALQNCGSTGFRETEVSIDGTPAGVAPIYPWIYTGGIDPYLWEPIPGVETLNFKPYRVDLTPFAALLSDGKTHTVAVSVFNADSGFDLASTLLLYTDNASTAVTGAVTSNTLGSAPLPQIEHYLNTAADGTVSGPVSVRSNRAWMTSGYVMTSHGRVDTSVQAYNTFSNLQDEKVSATEYKQSITQLTEQHELTTTTSSSGAVQTQHDSSYPLIVNYRQANNDNTPGFFVANYIKQSKIEALRTPIGPNSPTPILSSETIETTDTLHYNAAGSLLSHDNNAASSSYGAKDAQGNCVYRRLKANSLVLTELNDSTSCSLAP